MLALSWSPSSFAGPSVWAKAATPARYARARARAKVERLLRKTDDEAPPVRAAALRRAATLLDGIEARRALDPGLRFLRANVARGLASEPGARQDALRLYLSVGLDPTAPVALRASAYQQRANLSAEREDFRGQADAYEAARQFTPDPISQAVLLANQAEGWMGTGALRPAIDNYRRALRALNQPSMVVAFGVTTYWGLAVALDRQGDVDGAELNVGYARSFDPTDSRLFDSDSWIFVPARDEHWYRALGHWHRAEVALSGEEDVAPRQLAYAEAAAAYRRYIDLAPPSDPWRERASLRADACEKARRKAR